MKLRSPEPQRLLLKALDCILANPRARVLDVGAGNVVDKNRRAGQLVLADRYAELVQRPGYFGLDVESGTNVTLVGDAHALPIADNSLDAVLMVSVLEHLYDPLRAIDQVQRVLKPGGLYFSYAPFYHPYHASPHDYFRFTAEGYRHLLREFRKVELVSGGNYVAVLNDTLAEGLGGSRAARWAARFALGVPFSALFKLADHRLSTRIAAGFGALAIK